jgi:hypothetical protein
MSRRHRTEGDERGLPVDHPVPDSPGFVVAGIAGRQYLSTKRLPEGIDGYWAQEYLLTVQCDSHFQLQIQFGVVRHRL